MKAKHYRSFILVIGLCLISHLSYGDINVVKEVVITPKGVNVAGNIGSINSSHKIQMTGADVDITVGTPAQGDTAPLPLIVKAKFELVNKSDDELKLTVGFPVSNSMYSSYNYEWFRVTTDGSVRDVFQRKSSYPRHLEHEYVSGEAGPERAKPPADVDRETMKLFGEQFVGKETFHNLMVWEERFAPNQSKSIEVHYELQVPLQEKRIVRQKVEGNHKGIWPQEANNVPVTFLNDLPAGQYYFFDYYLTSGASWAGPIVSEDVKLHFGPSWQRVKLHSSVKENIYVSGGPNAGQGAPTSYLYSLRNKEPDENLYFAVQPPEEIGQGNNGRTK